MALLQTKIGQCKECKKYGPMVFVNHDQKQKYCDICKPLITAREISTAIETLKFHKVTPEMYEDFYRRDIK